MKKVVIIGSAYPLRGGLATYNERLAKAFQDNGDEVNLYTFNLQYPNFLFPGKTQFSEEPAPKDLRIKIAINSINPFNWIKVGFELKKQKPDLIIIKFWLPFMGPCFGTIARIAKSNNHTKIISIIDNIIPHEKRIGDEILANYFVKSVDAFIAMSHSVLHDLNTFDKVKPKRYSPHPLYDNFGEDIPKNIAKARLKLDENYSYMLFFGFIRDYKGLDWLLEAFSDKRFRGLSVKLIIAGEYYTDSKPFTDLIQKYKLEDFVINKNDFIPDSEVVDYFCAADIVVQPYKDATQSGVTQIAYHFNKPMLVTNVGGLAEIIPNGKVGYVVDKNVGAIAEALLDFYVNNREQELIPGVIEEKKKYSWDNMINCINDLFKLISKKR